MSAAPALSSGLLIPVAISMSLSGFPFYRKA